MDHAANLTTSKPPLLGSLGGLTSHMCDASRSILEKHGLSYDETSKWIRDRFETGIVDIYRQVFEYAIDDVGGRKKLAIKLLKHRSTLSHWLSKTSEKKKNPSLEHLFLGLAAFDIDIGPDMPRGREAVIHSMAMILPALRKEKLGGDGGLIRRTTLACLHYTRYSKRWARATKTNKPDDWKRATGEVMPMIRKQEPHFTIFDHNDILNQMRGWVEPWWVFHLTNPHNWQYEDAKDAKTM